MLRAATASPSSRTTQPPLRAARQRPPRLHVSARRTLHTPIDRFPGSIAVIELSRSPHFTAKFAIPGQGKDHWDKAEIEVRGTAATKEAIVPSWMNFLHGEVHVTADAKAETLSKHLAEEFQQRLLELQQRTPKVYEAFWRENGEHILEGFVQNPAIINPNLIMLPDANGFLHSVRTWRGHPPLSPVSDLESKTYEKLVQLEAQGPPAGTAPGAASYRSGVSASFSDSAAEQSASRRSWFIFAALAVAFVYYMLERDQNCRQASESIDVEYVVVRQQQQQQVRQRRPDESHAPPAHEESRGVSSAIADIAEALKQLAK